MPELLPFEQLDAGGVDSRSNPLNMPRNRALRCLNWTPTQAGFWQLRYGYSTVSMSTVSVSAISGMFSYRTWDGTKYVLFMQGTVLNVLNTGTGVVTTPSVLGTPVSSTAKGQAFFANNRFHYGNGTDQKWFDGLSWRDSGLRALTSQEVTTVVISEGVRELTTSQATGTTLTAGAGGTFPADVSLGHLMYVAIFDTASNEIGPATISVGSGRVKVALNNKITVGSLPNLSGVNANWVKLIGGTGDGNNIAYFFTNTSTAITVIAFALGTLSVTAVAHGLSSGDVVVLAGTSNADGVYVVTVTGANTFTIATNVSGLLTLGTVKRIVMAPNATTSVDVLGNTQDSTYQVNQDRGIAASTIGGVNAGYQFYASLYSPTGGGHVGNRTLIGGRALQTAYRTNWRISGLAIGGALGNIVSVEVDVVGLGKLIKLTMDRPIDSSINGTTVVLSGLSTATFLNGITLAATAVGNVISGFPFGGLAHGAYGPASDTGSVAPSNILADPSIGLLIGRTGDGALVPYACIDNASNWLFIAGNMSSVTVTDAGIDGNHQLPTRNGIIPSQCNMFCVSGDYCYAADTGSPYLRRSGNLAQALAGTFTGRPEQSWAPDDLTTFPTGEALTGLFEIDQESFCGTQHDCALSVNLAGIEQWVGPWAVGIAGRRAGIKCGAYGFFWVTGDKQVAMFQQGVPTPVSDEYELAELSQIGDAFLSTVEVSYYRNPAQNKDELRIEGQKADGTPYTIIHDFKLREGGAPGSIYGQGYSAQFQGPLATAFTVAQVRDGNSRMQVYAGASNGRIFQLYSGADDAGSQYTADAILLLNGGPDRLDVPYVDFHGDQNIAITVGRNLQTSLAIGAEFGFDPPNPADADQSQVVPGAENDFLYRFFLVPPEVQRLYLRFQLTSHSADGNLDLNSPPHVPLESYGRLYEFIPSIGDERGR